MMSSLLGGPWRTAFSAGVGCVMQDAPGVDEVKGLIGKRQLLGMGNAQIGLEPECIEATPHVIDRTFGQIDADQVTAGFGEQLMVGAQANTDLQHLLASSLVRVRKSRNERLELISQTTLSQVARFIAPRKYSSSPHEDAFQKSCMLRIASADSAKIRSAGASCACGIVTSGRQDRPQIWARRFDRFRNRVQKVVTPDFDAHQPEDGVCRVDASGTVIVDQPGNSGSVEEAATPQPGRGKRVANEPKDPPQPLPERRTEPGLRPVDDRPGQVGLHRLLQDPLALTPAQFDVAGKAFARRTRSLSRKGTRTSTPAAIDILSV